MKKSKFDYMGFNDGSCSDCLFVVHAKKHTKQEALKLCIAEYSHLFNNKYGGNCRIPSLEAVKEAKCAFRFGLSACEFPDGAYTIVPDDTKNAFCVWVIDLDALELEEES